MNKWRIPTWLILGWTGIMGLWLFAGLSGVPRGQSAAYSVGVAAGVSIIFFVWFVGFLVLSVIWFMTKPKGTADQLAGLQAARDGGVLTDEQYRAQAAALGMPGLRSASPVISSWCGRCGKPLSPAWVGKCKHCGARYAEFAPVASAPSARGYV